MKNVLLFSGFLILSCKSFSQVGVNTTVPNAQLDIRSGNQVSPASNDGILIPKVDTFSLVNPTALQQGMLVYLTTTQGANEPGFYYWDNASTTWMSITNSWRINGNAGTNQSLHFIGTTDTRPVVFRTNNIRSGLIETGIAGNTFLGFSAGLVSNTNLANTGVGSQALLFTTSGSANTATGNEALQLNTTGTWNTAIGRRALQSSISGNSNTAIGANALRIASEANGNTAIGFGAGSSITTGSNNIAIGTGAQVPSATDNNQIQIGIISSGGSFITGTNAGIGISNYAPTQALDVTGNIRFSGALMPGNLPGIVGQVLTSAGPGLAPIWNASTAWSFSGNAGTDPANHFMGTIDDVDVRFKRGGVYSGRIGLLNTSFGQSALGALSTGFNDVAFGTGALYFNTTGSHNTAVGYQALFANSSGNGNTAIGTLALHNNTVDGNTAIGYYSLNQNTTGNSNTATGYRSLHNNLGGIENTATGHETLASNTSGDTNTGNGHSTLYSNTTGSQNTAFGAHALETNTTGSNNTAIGVYALLGNTTASNNIAIGNGAKVLIVAQGNQVRIGNANIIQASIQVPWTITSDKHWKNSIKDSELGLDFIKKLNPVSYIRNNDDRRKTEYGFIAQELEAALNISGAVNNGIISKDDNGLLGIRYNDLLAPMVKAIQEQQQIIETGKKEMAVLQQKNNELEKRVKAIEEKLGR